MSLQDHKNSPGPFGLGILISFASLFFACQGPAKKLAKKQKAMADSALAVFDSFGFRGSMIVLDEKGQVYLTLHPEDTTGAYIPASTYKIPNSIIGLETGVIRDTNMVIPWDREVRKRPEWNKDMKLREAFAVSCVPWYQELARRIGQARMDEWLKKLRYGNMNSGGGLDKFWLSGDIRVSHRQQLDFLWRFRNGLLPIGKRTTAIVREIMVRDSSVEWTLYGKTGWGENARWNVGWFVGLIEFKDGRVRYFSNRIYGPLGGDPEKFIDARKEMVSSILLESKK